MLPYHLRRHAAASLGGLLAPSAATLAAVVLSHLISIPNISLLYLPAILFVAMYFGTWSSLVAATVAVIEYDFFLLRPLYTFTINRPEDILAFVIFVIVAILTGQVAARARDRAEAVQRRARESTMLYELGRALMSSHDVSEVLQTIARRIVDDFGVDRCAIFVPDDAGHLSLAAEATLGPRDRASTAAARYAFQERTQVGLPVAGAPGTSRVYIPLEVGDRILGVMEAGRKRSGEALDADEHRLLTSFAAQAALAIVRAQSEDERRRLTILEESDTLKSALLSAVSHDLRTPLAAIKASATSLLLSDASWTEEEGREFLQAIDQEADRLNRLVGNLLDLSRIEAGVLRPILDWYDIGELIEDVLPRLRHLLGDRSLEIHLQPGLPPVHLDLMRMEELLVNLVENAARYTPAGSLVELEVTQMGGQMRLALIDHGPGVPVKLRQRIFTTFYQGRDHSDRHHGSGLGLAICRGIAQAHGGRIHVEDTPGGGATFVLLVPIPVVDQQEHAGEVAGIGG
ncbi:MAG: DUF4118 domain-containing protein [Chloroflexota bacterium]|nr:DUF4118 domain-containing protein [Chloroflexota bacterium]